MISTFKLLSNQEKCLFMSAFIFPTFAYFSTGAISSILIVLFLISLYLLKTDNIKKDQSTKWLTACFIAFFIASIPNVIMDNMYEPSDKIRLSAFDIPLQYLAGGLILLGFSKIKLKVEYFFYGILIGSVYAFINYPIISNYFLGATRYITTDPDFWVGRIFTLRIAYFSSALMVISLIIYTYFHQLNKRNSAIFALIAANLASITMIESGSKAALICYPLVLVLMVIVRKRFTLPSLLALTSPILTAVAFFTGHSFLLLGSILVCLPAFLVDGSKKHHKYILIALIISVISFSLFSNMRGDQSNDIEQRLMADISQMDSKTTSTGLRLGMWVSGIHSFIDSPILGQGYVQREFFNNQLVDKDVIVEQLRIERGKGKGSLHNEIINAMAKKGVIGLIAVLSMYLIPFFLFIHFLRKNEANFYPALAGISFIGTFVVVGLTEAPLMQTGSSLMYIFSIIFVFLSLDRTEMTIEPELK